MGELNSDDHCIYYCRQKSHRKNWVALTINKSLKYSTKKWQNDLGSFLRQATNITVIQVYAPTTKAKEANQFCEDPEDLLELKPKKDALFITTDWNAKVGSQDIPGVIGKV